MRKRSVWSRVPKVGVCDGKGTSSVVKDLERLLKGKKMISNEKRMNNK